VRPGRSPAGTSVRMIKPSRGIALATASAIVFGLLARRAGRGTITAGEERWFRAINNMSPALRAPVWVVMQSGSLAAVPLTAAAVFPRHRPTAVAMAIDGTAVWALCKLVKRVIRRGRPGHHLSDVVIYGAEQRGAGFPSGHAAVATTLVTIGSRVLPKRAARVVWAVPVIVGASRQFVGAHLPLDVAGGAALGLSTGTLANLVLDATAG
jgi:membrane-associated phospholipid phosphatase